MYTYKYWHFIDIPQIDRIKIMKFDWQKTAHNWDDDGDGDGDDNSKDNVNDYANKGGRCIGLYLYHPI